MQEGDTLTKFLSESGSKNLVILLQKHGVITRQTANKYIGKNGLLNEDGRRFFARALVGRILPNADALDLLFSAQPSLRNNLARAVPFILQAASVAPKWDVSNAMADAARIYSAVRAGKFASIKEWLRQSALFSSGVRTTTATLLLAEIFLDHNGQVKLARGFRRYAETADRERTISLLGPGPPPVQALADAFGAPLIEGKNVLAVTSFSPTAVATARKRNGNGKKNGNGKRNGKRNGNGKHTKKTSVGISVQRVTVQETPPAKAAREAGGQTCQGGLSREQAAKGLRLFAVTFTQDGKTRRECFRSKAKIKYVVAAKKPMGNLLHAVSWHTSKAEADKAVRALVGQSPIQWVRAKVRKATEDKTAYKKATKGPALLAKRFR
jgi:hypothetical protein